MAIEWDLADVGQSERNKGIATRMERARTQGYERGDHVALLILRLPRDPSTSSNGTWTLQTHPKHLLRGYLDP